jgi:hypothetical protein
VRREEGVAGRLTPRLLDLPPGVVDARARPDLPDSGDGDDVAEQGGLRERGGEKGVGAGGRGRWGKEGVGVSDWWVLRVSSLDEGEIKDDECGRSEYKGKNLADQTRIFRLKEWIKDDECGWYNYSTLRYCKFATTDFLYPSPGDGFVEQTSTSIGYSHLLDVNCDCKNKILYVSLMDTRRGGHH